MKNILAVIFTLSMWITGSAQSVTVKNDSTSKVHTAENFGYSVQIPLWLEVFETEANSFGGMLPAVENIKNAILITAFEKEKFKSFEDFQRIYITGNIFGKKTLYSEEHIWYGTNERDFKQISNGVTSRVFTLYKNKIYHNQFVLLETSKAYLFINFCATPETYDTNLTKFEEFLKALIVK